VFGPIFTLDTVGGVRFKLGIGIDGQPVEATVITATKFQFFQ
jgi:hypothetical protein